MRRGRGARLAASVLFLSVAGTVAGVAQTDEGIAALRAGRYDDAVKQLSRSARDVPNSAPVARALATAYLETGRYDDAEQAARRFISANAASPELWNTLGEVLVQTGRTDEAEQAFTRAIEGKASESLRAKLNRAVLMLNRGSRTEAFREFDEFIDVYNRSERLTSDELTAVATAVHYLGADNWELYNDALRAYDEAIALDTTSLEPRIRVGELLLEKYESQQARAAFEEVSKRNPRHPRLLLGLARTDRFDGKSSSIERVRESLAVNPNYVQARVFLAGLLSELENYEEAAREIARALEVNPASLEALATSAAIRFLMDDERGFEAAVNRALAINPSYADLYNTLADVSAKNRRYHQAVEFAKQAVALDSKSWRAFVLLGMNELRIGNLPAGRAHLDTAFTGDPFNAWTKNTLDLMDTLVQYPRTSTERFEFFVDAKESELLSLYLGPLAEEAYDRLATKYGYRPPTPIRVEVFPDHADFSVRTVGLVGLGALGVSFGPVMAMDSPSARKMGAFNWGSTFWHELAHTFHLGMTDGRVPRWFTEGLAVFEERQARSGWGADITPAFLSAFKQQRLVPLNDLNRGFMRPAFPEQIGFSYYQASLICELIQRDHGSAALVEMLAGFKSGESTAQAFQRVLGTDLERFQDLFDAYVEERFTAQLAALKDDGPVGPGASDELLKRAARDPSDFVAQLAAGRHHFAVGKMTEAVEFLERAKALFPQYAGQDSPYWFLAQIHKANGSTERAARELTELVRFNEEHYEAHVELADLRLMLGDSSGAAAALEAAMFIYPFESQAHERLAGLYRGLQRHPDAVRERSAVVALDPVDRAAALYQLALAHFEGGDLRSARRAVLACLETAPSFEEAQELLLRIYDARGSGS